MSPIKFKENKKKVQIAKSKTAAISLAILMIVSIGASMLLIPSAQAHTPAWSITTHAFVQPTPAHVGIGDKVYIYMWLDKVFAGASMTNTYRFHDFQLTITDPDGLNETKTFAYIGDTTSSTGYSYAPTKNGTYKVTFNFPGQDVNKYDHPTGSESGSAYVNDTYTASSATANFTVQETSIGYLPNSYPMPTEYWSRPIYGENTDWWSISSNWLGNGAPGYGGFASSYNSGGNGQLFPDDAVGPMTSHIMWTKPLQSGGVVGGDNYEIDGNTYFEGSAYIQRYQNPIIVNGKIYYSEPIGYSSGTGGATKCVDLRTGELIWSRTDVPALSFAWIPDYENPNQHGVYNAMLVSGYGGFFGPAPNWLVYDADTGDFLFNVTGIPSSNSRGAMGPNGEVMYYAVQNTAGWGQPANYVLGEWNSTKLWDWSSNTPAVDTPLTGMGPYGPTHASTLTTAVNGSAETRYDYKKNITWANSMPPFMIESYGMQYPSSIPFTIVEAYYGDMILCYNATLPKTGGTMFFGSERYVGQYTYFAINLNSSKGEVGSIRWMKTYDAPKENVTILMGGVDPVNRVFVENYRETQNFVGYNLDTGAKLWGPTEPQAPMDYYGSPASGSLANAFYQGKMYSAAYAGIVYCYDTKNGSLLWTYGNGGAGNSTDSGFAVPGNYPTFVSAFGNGVVYTVTTEHTIETPLYKGSMHRALNATTGEEIWTLNSYTGEFFTTSYAIADGYATWFNGLDNQIYSVGRGSSATTVSAPQAAIEFGRSLVITGKVVDTSAGTTQDEQAAKFPNGVPAASDASMKDWMGYVYQQKPMPSNFTGVDVTISVIDGNGNFRNIGVAKTDASGSYSLQWKPDIEGKYTVIANFAGTNGYWPSYSETAFAVDPAPATPTPTAAPEKSMADLYFIPAIAGILVAIIVVGIAIILVLRKRP